MFYLQPGHTLETEPNGKVGAVTYAGLGDGITFLSEPFEKDTENYLASGLQTMDNF